MVTWYQMTDLSEDPSHEVFKIYSLSGDQLVEFLEENGFSSEVCQIFTGSHLYSRVYFYVYVWLIVDMIYRDCSSSALSF